MCVQKDMLDCFLSSLSLLAFMFQCSWEIWHCSFSYQQTRSTNTLDFTFSFWVVYPIAVGRFGTVASATSKLGQLAYWILALYILHTHVFSIAVGRFGTVAIATSKLGQLAIFDVTFFHSLSFLESCDVTFASIAVGRFGHSSYRYQQTRSTCNLEHTAWILFLFHLIWCC